MKTSLRIMKIWSGQSWLTLAVGASKFEECSNVLGNHISPFETHCQQIASTFETFLVALKTLTRSLQRSPAEVSHRLSNPAKWDGEKMLRTATFLRWNSCKLVEPQIYIGNDPLVQLC
jgi:hypothetical protein